jgi:hypothetical protein
VGAAAAGFCGSAHDAGARCRHIVAAGIRQLRAS